MLEHTCNDQAQALKNFEKITLQSLITHHNTEVLQVTCKFIMLIQLQNEKLQSGYAALYTGNEGSKAQSAW